MDQGMQIPAENVAMKLAQKIAKLEYDLAVKDVAVEQLQQALQVEQAKVKSLENAADTPNRGLPDETPKK